MLPTHCPPRRELLTSAKKQRPPPFKIPNPTGAPPRRRNPSLRVLHLPAASGLLRLFLRRLRRRILAWRLLLLLHPLLLLCVALLHLLGLLLVALFDLLPSCFIGILLRYVLVVLLLFLLELLMLLS